MTKHARQVLNDCRLALAMLEDETDLRRWRIHWVAALALVRAVGHVLDKVDGKNPSIKAIAQGAYAEWKSDAPEHEIFREFVERERNMILKEYEFNIHPEAVVEIAVVQKLRRCSDVGLVHAAQTYPIGDNIYRPLMGGFRELDDARDVLSDAIDWWDAELAEIESRVATKEVKP